MGKKFEQNRPSGLLRLFYRLPILLYRIHMGWLLGDRFLLLTHRGRKSGLPRRTVLEVLRHDEKEHSYMVVSAYGKRSDWYQNVLQHPAVKIQIGRRKYDARAVPLSEEDTYLEFMDYNRRHPNMIFSFANLVGLSVDRSEEGLKHLAEHMKAVKFVDLSRLT